MLTWWQVVASSLLASQFTDARPALLEVWRRHTSAATLAASLFLALLHCPIIHESECDTDMYCDRLVSARGIGVFRIGTQGTHTAGAVGHCATAPTAELDWAVQNGHAGHTHCKRARALCNCTRG